jgi:hypothetical protein
MTCRKNTIFCLLCIEELMALATICRSLLFALSFFALPCLICDHRLCPADHDGQLVKLRHVSRPNLLAFARCWTSLLLTIDAIANVVIVR